MGFLARVAEHWLGTHSQARAFQCPLAGCGFASGWARAVRQHLARDHHSDPAAADHLLRDNPALDDLTRYLQRLKTKVNILLKICLKKVYLYSVKLKHFNRLLI